MDDSENVGAPKGKTSKRKLPPKFSGKLRRSLNKIRFLAAMKALSKTAAASDFEPSDRRRFLFDENALKKGGSLTELLKEKLKREEDFNDVVDQDDNRVDYYVSQILVEHIIESFTFKTFIFSLIIINSVFIGLQTNEIVAVNYQVPFIVFDQFVLAAFVMEILLKWYYGFWIFWKVGWNVFDFIIIVMLLIGPQLTFLSSARILRILRVLRAFRSLKSVTALASLSVVIQTIIISIPDMTNIVLLLTIIVVAFGVVGVTLFSKAFPAYFGTLPNAMFTQFICITQDGWASMFKEFQDYSPAIEYMGAVYFFLVILIGSFVFSNLIVAVVITNLEGCMKETEKQEKIETTKEGTSETKIPFPENSTTGRSPIITLEDIKLHYKNPEFGMQMPMETVLGFNKLTMQNLEKYLIVLSALEENLVEYFDIKNDLVKIFEIVRNLNIIEGEVNSEESMGTTKGTTKARPSVPPETFTRGDIVSNIIELQEKGVFKKDDESRTISEYIKSYHG